MSEEEMIAEPEVKKSKKERKHAPGAFAAFESKYHIVGNVLILVVCIALIAMCAFSNATFGIIPLSDGSQAEVSQNMIQMGSAFTAFAMSDEELVAYKTSADKLISESLEKKFATANIPSDDPEAIKEAYEQVLAEQTEINFARYVLVSALLQLKAARGTIDADLGGITPPAEGEEEDSIIDTVQLYVTFGLSVVGVGAALPMALAVLSLVILSIKGLFILILCRNGKSLHIAFPLTCTFTILSLLMLQLGAVGNAGIFLYALFGAAFAGMLIVGVVRYAAYPNKFIGKGLFRYMFMDAAFISAFCLSLTNPLTFTATSGESISLSIGQAVSSGMFTKNIPAEFDLAAWLIPLGVAAIMVLATLIMGCIMAFMAAFAWVYSYLCNTYLDLGGTFAVNMPMFIAPCILAALLLLLLIVRPTKKVKKLVTEDIDE